ncbi:MAG: hypothetical protein PVG25_07125 [Anaerolineae bacterium]
MTRQTCPKCEAGGQLRAVRRGVRILLALSTGVVILIPGLALTMLGAGLPLLVASPRLALALLVLPLQRCRSCGHIAVRRSGT